MSPLVNLFLTVLCTTGNPAIAQQIERAAIEVGTDPAIALAIGVIESGLNSGNPLGVRGCYGNLAKKVGNTKCIRIGVISIRNRLAKVGHVSKPCRRTQNPKLCQALVNYNQGPHKYRYAAKVMAMVATANKRLPTRH